jgi:hypothetical protein
MSTRHHTDSFTADEEPLSSADGPELRERRALSTSSGDFLDVKEVRWCGSQENHSVCDEAEARLHLQDHSLRALLSLCIACKGRSAGSISEVNGFDECSLGLLLARWRHKALADGEPCFVLTGRFEPTFRSNLSPQGLAALPIATSGELAMRRGELLTVTSVACGARGNGTGSMVLASWHRT